MTEEHFSIRPWADAKRGELEVDSRILAYLDLRVEPKDTASQILEQFITETNARTVVDVRSPRAIVVSTPQTSDALALTLATQGIYLIVAACAESLSAVFDRFREQMRVISTRGFAGDVAAGTVGAAGRAVASPRRRSESPFSQYPPGFDRAAFDERMRELQQPWSEENAWKYES